MASSSSSLHSSASSSHKLLASRKVFSSSLFNGFQRHRRYRFIASFPSSHATSRSFSCLSIKCAVRFDLASIYTRNFLKGKVKQIVGSTLRDLKEEDGSALVTNFESDKTGSRVCKYDSKNLGGLQVGGGINVNNALSYIEEGASHVIVTSYVFNNGQMDLERLKDLVRVVGKQKLVLDLSCRKKEGRYAIVTDRWQKFSDVYLDEKVLEFLANYADEFLVHGVDVEGKRLGIDEELVALLGRHSPIPVTYAGGVTVMNDLERIKVAGDRRVDVTVGSALDIFGGNLPYKDVVSWHTRQETLMV
ncbi:hypothetical protein POTOM_015476 [Populus tomentosa]|uniref:1-(5-phosphoribosyl)-5-[(5-phosphoribosylamino)methylideneamino] imidazole-4-carboxamide isomerase HISN3, chloroplastic n=1 Tax=Populus tomentosa TaxID=118781 RepID=A0A8X8D657_POPTO|nr:hypothetical protein POTOM_015476 [Populus tomentosa]